MNYLGTLIYAFVRLQVLHYLDTIRPQELLAQMLTTSYLLVADGLRTPLADYMVSPVLIEQFEELYARMVSLLPSLYMQSKVLHF